MKIGVIGTGNMGENHIKTYLDLKNSCTLIGIYDTDEKRKLQIAKKYRVKPFASMDELLRSVDAVSIAVPTEHHFDVGKACIDHRVHMLMEKPITNTIVQGKELAKQAQDANVILQVGHIELFNPTIQALAKKLENDKVIAIHFKRMSPSTDRTRHADVVKDLMIHDLYILNMLLKDRMKDFYAFGKTRQKIPQHADVIAKFENGVLAHLTASYYAKRKVRTIEILTEHALYEADILNGEIFITHNMTEETSNIPVSVKQMLYVDQSLLPLTAQLLNFIDSIKNNKEPFVPARDGIEALKTANKISQSIIK